MFPDGRLSGRPIAALLEASGLKEAAESYEQEEASPVSIREHIQKNIIVNALESAKGNVTQAAKMAGIPRSTFYKRLKNSNSPPDNCKKQAYFSWLPDTLCVRPKGGLRREYTACERHFGIRRHGVCDV